MSQARCSQVLGTISCMLLQAGHTCINQYSILVQVDISKDARALQKLRREAERAKRALSSQHQVRVEVESLAEGVDLSEPLTRARFEELNNDLFKKTLGPVKRVGILFFRVLCLLYLVLCLVLIRSVRQQITKASVTTIYIAFV